MSKLMSKDEWDVLCAVEEHHMRRGKFPSIRTITNKTQVSQGRISEILKNPVFQTALENRGIEWRPVSSDLLSPDQIATIQVLLDVSDRRTIKDKLKALGVAPSKYYGWKKQPKFIEAYREASEALYGESLPEVHRSVIQEAVNGSYQHQKLMLAISGRWDEKRQNEQLNVRYILMKVLEIIQVHVSDPEKLQAIAGEFETLLNPETPAITATIDSNDED